jgi:hypothetical protein
MRVNQDFDAYFEAADRDELSYRERLAEYRRHADAYFELERYAEFCAGPLAHADEVMLELVASAWFDELLVATVHTTFPAHEHERFVAHYRGLLGAWVRDAAG